MNSSSSSVPLAEALPWRALSTSSRTILVGDTIETDGRFLLHTLAAQVDSPVLWLAVGPATDLQIATALKKAGGDVGAKYLSRKKSNSLGVEDDFPLRIESLSVEMATLLASDEAEFRAETYLKRVYQRIKAWIYQSQEKDAQNGNVSAAPWIIIDDLSLLSSVCGEQLAYRFVSKIFSLAKVQSAGLLIRHSQDEEYSLASKESQSSSSEPTWVGAGGGAMHETRGAHIPWQRSLVELADILVDVLPLSSGYSREAHGRLVFSEQPGGQRWFGAQGKTNACDAAWQHSAMNYCITDGGVRAIRLRGTTG